MNGMTNRAPVKLQSFCDPHHKHVVTGNLKIIEIGIYSSFNEESYLALSIAIKLLVVQ